MSRLPRLVEMCAYCPWPGVATVHERRTLLDRLLGRPARSHKVCYTHIPSRRRSR